jgi:hypothetical protein
MAHVPTARYPICPLCSEHIEIESAKTDEKGSAVHGDCYVAHITKRMHNPYDFPLRRLRARSTETMGMIRKGA